MKIPMSEIRELMKRLDIDQEEAIELWKCDAELASNEEQDELDAAASAVQRERAGSKKRQNAKSAPRTVKTSDEKKELFSEIISDLQDVYGADATVLKENKLIQVKIGDKIFKIDVIQQRNAK